MKEVLLTSVPRFCGGKKSLTEARLLAGLADGCHQRRHLVLEDVDEGAWQRHERAPCAVC